MLGYPAPVAQVADRTGVPPQMVREGTANAGLSASFGTSQAAPERFAETAISPWRAHPAPAGLLRPLHFTHAERAATAVLVAPAASLSLSQQLHPAPGQQQPYAENTTALTLPSAVPAAPPHFVSSAGQSAPSRWSGDSWLLWRRDGGGVGIAAFAGPSYGASQAGAVLRYRLAPGSRYQPQAYLRGSTALNDPRESELAFGLAVRPLAAVPATLLVEGRAARSGGHTRWRPAVAVVSALPPLRLPLDLRGEAYVQAGYVGGPGATAFVDGQARIDRPFVRLGRAELRGGAETWGGAQRGASRLDFGPSVTLAVPLGKVTARLAADWRFRVAGQAVPSSGPALTLSAGF